MENNGLELVIINDPMTRCKKFYFRRRVIGGSIYYNFKDDMSILESTLINNAQAVEDKPSLRLDDEMFFALVDAIHRDYKPSQGKFTEGKLEATEKHLEDMRKLVFQEVKNEGKMIFTTDDSIDPGFDIRKIK